MEDRKFRFDCDTKRFVNRVSGNEIPDDEPVFLFRARDRHALVVLQLYQMRSTDDHHKQAVQENIDEFEAFAHEHPERMKEPGTTHHYKLKSDFVEGSKGGSGRDSIKKSHRAEGRNFVD